MSQCSQHNANKLIKEWSKKKKQYGVLNTENCYLKVLNRSAGSVPSVDNARRELNGVYVQRLIDRNEHERREEMETRYGLVKRQSHRQVLGKRENYHVRRNNSDKAAPLRGALVCYARNLVQVRCSTGCTNTRSYWVGRKSVRVWLSDDQYCEESHCRDEPVPSATYSV